MHRQRYRLMARNQEHPSLKSQLETVTEGRPNGQSWAGVACINSSSVADFRYDISLELD
jgi:hypothetical protein